MDWKEDLKSNIYLFPRGMKRAGADSGNTIHWTSKYGSVITAGYDIGTSDGMNEKGLVANILYLTESSYNRPGDTRPVMGISIWTQYVLDNFATVDEAVQELRKELFRIDAPDMPNGAQSKLHLAISDTTGNSAIFEYINGQLIIHECRECQIMTNSPTYEKQITLNNYWQQIGGLTMLPGTNRAADRFVRASFYINTIPQTSDQREAVAGVFSVMRNVSVPLGISTPDQPNIASTRWRTVADQKNKVYFLQVLKFSVGNAARAWKPKNLMLVVTVLLLMPFLNMGMASGVLSSISIPNLSLIIFGRILFCPVCLMRWFCFCRL